MRIVKEIPHPKFKISVFSWNDKYLIKFENGSLEQTYKVSEWDVTEEKDLDIFFSEDFTNKISLRFDEMSKDLNIVLESF